MNTEEIKALVLCGGKGTRLGSLTKSTPKPLITINGRPVLSYIIDHIEEYGIEQLIVASGYLSEKITDYFAHHHKALNIQIVNSGDVDIVQRIKDVAPYISGDFILFYGDTVSDVDIGQLIDYHHSHPGKATITVWPLQCQFGVMDVDSKGMISAYKEKPVLDKWMNIGYFYFDHIVLSWLDKVDRFEDFIQYLVDNNELNGFTHNGVHITVNTLQELEEAKKNIVKLKRS